MYSSFIKVKTFDKNGNDLSAKANEIIGEEKEQLQTILEISGLINTKEEVDLLINVKINNFEDIAITIFDVNDIAQEK